MQADKAVNRGGLYGFARRSTRFRLPVRNRLLAGFVLAVSLIAYPLLAQQGTEHAYRLRTNVVSIPVYVTDSDGKPVGTLTAADFEVREGRTPCEIEAVEFIDHFQIPADAYAPRPPETRRQFLLLYDLSYTNSGGLLAARDAGIDFVGKNTSPSDLVAVATIAGRGGIDLLCPFTTDRERALSVLADLGLADSFRYRDPAGFSFEDIRDHLEFNEDDGAPGSKTRLLEHIERLRYSSTVSNYSRVMRNLAVALQRLHGRKNMILFSDGFDEAAIVGDLHTKQKRPSVEPTGEELARVVYDEFMEALKEFSRAGGVFYVVSTARLQGLSTGRADQHMVPPDPADHLAIPNLRYAGVNPGDYVLFRIAEQTSGFLYKNLNDLDSVLQDISSRTAAGYVISFKPSHPGKPGEFREIKVRVKQRGLRLDHQRGYFFDKEYREFSAEEKLIQLGEYVSKDIVSRRTSVDFDVHVFKGNDEYARLPVIVEIDGIGLASLPGRNDCDRLEVEVFAYLLDEINRPRDFFCNTAVFEGSEALARLREGNFKYYGLLLATPGYWKVKVIVRVCELGIVSADVRAVEVPDTARTGLRLTGPIFLDRNERWRNTVLHDDEATQNRRKGLPTEYPFKWKGNDWLPAVNPSVDHESGLFYLRIAGLSADKTGNQPSVDLKLTAIDENGAELQITRVAVQDRNIDGNDLEILLSPAFDGLAPGQYTLRVYVTDRIAAASAAAQTPFMISEE